MKVTPIPNNLREFRKGRKWTGEKLAARSGVSVRTIVSIESQRGNCRQETKRKLVAVFGLLWTGGKEKIWPEQK